MWRVLLLLSGLGGLRMEGNFGNLPVQITVPEKIRSIKKEGIESQIFYKIVIEGKPYTVNLMQKNFLPNNFRVYGYSHTGIMKPLDQDLQNFCHYQGYIEGYPKSVVMVSTCTGLRGLLQFENVSYGIEPLESSVGFEHVIYQVKQKKADVSLYTEKDIESRDLPYKIQSIEPQPDFAKYIEMHVVVEKQLYNHMGSDTTIVTQKIFQLIGLTNAIFVSFNLTIILSSLELWIDENKIATTGDANDLLRTFLKWKRSYLVLRPHDVAFLLVYREKSNYVGATLQGKMCDANYAGGVLLHPRTISLESLAVILAQLLSLSMGITYDDIHKCHCSGAVCVMNPEAIHFSGVKIFSNCSIEDFAHFISKQKSQCLHNQPRLDLFFKQQPVCGNAILEAGEECDCGTEENCTFFGATCCDSATCRFKAGFKCAEGPCCENCLFSSKQRECRSAFDECDLPEYCNGSSASCPENHYIQTGHPCGMNQWLCIDGVCMTGDKQCKDMFGQEAEFGPAECYSHLNSKTDISGNCGKVDSGYTPCGAENLQCGKLICKYVGAFLLKIPRATTIYANISGHLCVAVEFPSDHADSQKTWIKDGTSCGSNKACRNQRCVSSSYLGYDCTQQKCNSKGVCNNKKHCHCSPSYLPPNCAVQSDSWPGGSIDSGNFPPTANNLPQRRFIENIYHSKPMRWPLFLFIPFFIIFCVLIAIMVKVYFQRKKWRTEDYSSDEQLESESEPKG
ncbi:disintegrin and metalloproteinase domain-containing protein 2 isoform X1 [Saimiri boliviensis]|uniref:Disintegrin and metalloproteinase domain-containing protein 2 n=1 Tax=Saimiri boliviensis boliviensis TaxID=39432 RepID=A0A2K6SPZ9_SAIBB|nr:disintegrin and metalloproteinase domain-containing protein 2 [Saimiri boliviensis boliviensis]